MKDPSFSRITSRASRSREDQLTEVLALVLKTSPTLAQLFAKEVVEDCRGWQVAPRLLGSESWEVGTQLTYEAELSGRPDLVLESANHVLWVEAKLDSGPGMGQLMKYYGALRKKCEDTGATGALIYLTRQGASSGPVSELVEEIAEAPGPRKRSDPAICEFDWTQLADLMGRYAKGQEGSTQANLAEELKKYLIESGAMIPPLNEEKSVSHINDFGEIKSGLWQLLNSVMGQVYDAFDRRKEDHKRPKNPSSWPGFPRYQAWYKIDDSELVLGFPLLLEWNFDVREWGEHRDPAIAWGLTLESGEGQWPEDADGLVTRMKEKGFLTLPDGNHPRLYKQVPLETILAAGNTEDRIRALSHLVVPGLKVAQREAESWISEASTLPA